MFFGFLFFMTIFVCIFFILLFLFAFMVPYWIFLGLMEKYNPNFFRKRETLD